MKRTFAAVALLAALGVLLKLGFKSPEARVSGPEVGRTLAPSALAPKPDDLIERYRSSNNEERALVARVWDKFRQTAVMIDRTDGLRGLELLDRLDLEAIYLYEKHPKEFRQLRDLVSDRAAAEILLHWRDYFGYKRGDDTDRGTLIAEVSRLTSSQKRLVSRYPNVLPIVLADPTGVSELAESLGGDEQELADALVLLSLISLDSGSSDLRSAERILERHQSLALEAFRLQGLQGFALVGLFGAILEELPRSIPLDQALILVRVNANYVSELLESHRPETVANHLARVFSAGPSLVEAVGGHPEALRLVVEQGEVGEKALLKAGSDAAEVVYGNFTDEPLRKRAVVAISDHGAMALAILDKYASDPDFCQILKQYGSVIIPPIAKSDTGPEVLAYLRSKKDRSIKESLANVVLFASGENGQATIRQIRDDGPERVASLDSSQLAFYQFLPMYDVLHLGNVLRNGYAPTSGELTWAVLDGCFVIADALSLAALQPEGVVAAEAVKGELKAAAREGVKAAGREAVETASESAGKGMAGLELKGLKDTADSGSAATQRLARWWTVRSAGGAYQVLRRTPEALPKLSLAQVVELAKPLCAKLGLRLSPWRPARLWKDGVERVFRIPPERGLKYLSAQLLQAGVGVVGFQKMEEHLSSRRPTPRTMSE